MKRLALTGFVVALCVLLTEAMMAQASGTLDPSFGSGGVVVSNVPGSAKAEIRKVAFQPDGRIVILYHDFDSTNSFTSVLGRFTTAGELDLTFGNSGLLYLDWPTGLAASARNIAIQSDGKIVVSGAAPLGRNAAAMRFERYNSDGTIDSSFGTGGSLTVNVVGSGALALQPDGKILAMSGDSKLVRLNPNGSLDSAFGNGGIASPKLALTPWSSGLLVLPSGKIIATGRLESANIGYFAVAGYNTNGSLDDGGKSDSTPGNQFGSKGSVIINLPGYTGGRGIDLKLDQSGKIVVLGAAGNQNTALAMARLTANGQLDSGFGTGGRLVFSDPNGSPQGTALAIQTDGRIVVIGGYYMGNAPDGSVLRDAMVVRFTTSGALDSFDVAPFVTTDIFGADELAYDGDIRFDPGCQCERIIWAGASVNGTGSSFAPLMLQFIP